MKITYKQGNFIAIAENDFEKELLVEKGDQITKHLKKVYNEKKTPNQ